MTCIGHYDFISLFDQISCKKVSIFDVGYKGVDKRVTSLIVEGTQPRFLHIKNEGNNYGSK